MQIRQLTATLDAKLLQLDQQLTQLEQRAQHEGPNASEQLKTDIAALQRVRAKLIKSKDIALRAHELHSDGEGRRRERQRILGLTMCTVSVLGGVVLMYFALR